MYTQNTHANLPLVGNICTNGAVGTKLGQIVKFVEMVHDCILSKQQRNEMNRRYMVRYESFDRAPPAVKPFYILSKPQQNEMNRQYCDGGLSGMNALTAQRFISVQSHELR